MTVLVTQKAPDFRSSAVLADGTIVNDFHFHTAIAGKKALLFFYPLDFTFVCPSELIALNNRIDAFKKRGVEVFGVSIDSHFSHLAWRKTPVEAGGIGPLGFTLVADIAHSICQSYGVEHPQAKVALRGAFLIDEQGTVRSQMVNDLPLGRNMDEILRLFDAIDFHQKHGEVCPANWQQGKEGMKATAEGVASYLSENQSAL